MRTINHHKVNPADERLTIEVLAEPCAGGANHVYEVRGYEAKDADETAVVIRSQNGSVNEAGMNGLTQEVLLATPSIL